MFEELAENDAAIQSGYDEKRKEIDQIYYNALSSGAGKKMLKELYSRFCENAIAVPGDDLLQIGIRQGRADLVRQMYLAVERARSN